MMGTDSRRGFTLLEVMVALAILGLALTAILSAQAGLYSANVQARNITVATSAARCKMAELEEKLLKDGYPEIDKLDEGFCCAGESPPGVSCKWAIERVTLPDPPQQNLMSDAGGIGAMAGAGGAAGAGPRGALGGLAPLGALAGAAANPASLADGGIAGLAGMLGGGMGAGGMAGAGGVAGMAMGIVYPQLRPLLEASIRRVTVDVQWNEGPIARSVKLVQFVTHPERGLPPIDPLLGAGAASGGTPGVPTGAVPASPFGGAGLAPVPAPNPGLPR